MLQEFSREAPERLNGANVRIFSLEPVEAPDFSAWPLLLAIGLLGAIALGSLGLLAAVLL